LLSSRKLRTSTLPINPKVTVVFWLPGSLSIESSVGGSSALADDRSNLIIPSNTSLNLSGSRSVEICISSGSSKM